MTTLSQESGREVMSGRGEIQPAPLSSIRCSAREFVSIKKDHARCQHQYTRIKTGKPKWLRRSLPTGPEYEKIRQLLKNHDLTTVCREAKCPNQFECYGKGTATFMILGERCTRNCRFCAVGHQPESPPDPEEPERVAEAVVILGLRYAVVTSVTRDDLADGGASFFAETYSINSQTQPQDPGGSTDPGSSGKLASVADYS